MSRNRHTPRLDETSQVAIEDLKQRGFEFDEIPMAVDGEPKVLYCPRNGLPLMECVNPRFRGLPK